VLHIEQDNRCLYGGRQPFCTRLCTCNARCRPATLVQLHHSHSSACRKRRAVVAVLTAGHNSPATHVSWASTGIILSILWEATSIASGFRHSGSVLLLMLWQVAEFEEESVRSRFAAGWQVRVVRLTNCGILLRFQLQTNKATAQLVSQVCRSAGDQGSMFPVTLTPMAAQPCCCCH
jgi:hypothetical protein